MEAQFWQNKSLSEMDQDEWEALCDGCAQCCLQKLQDEYSGEVFYTRLACELLDIESGLCRNYEQRLRLVSDCMKVSLADLDEFHWLPFSCAYRTLAEGRPLQPWHPLISGSQETVHRAGISVRGKAIPDQGIAEEDWEDHIVRWVKL